MGQKLSLEQTRDKAREWQSELKSEVRRMDREIRKIQAEETKLQRETQAQAAKGNVSSVQMLAKQIVKTRHAVRRLERTKVSLHAVSLNLSTSVSTMATTGSLKISADAMKQMNAITGNIQVSSALSEMRKQMEKTADMEEQMDDALMDSEEDGEADAEVQKVLEELALAHMVTLSQPTGVAGATPSEPAAVAQPQASLPQLAPRQPIGELSAPPAKRPRVEPPQQQQTQPAAVGSAAAPPPAAVVPLSQPEAQPAAALTPAQYEAQAQALLASRDAEIEQLRARLAVAEHAVGVAAAASGQATAAVGTASSALGSASALAASLPAQAAAADAVVQGPQPQAEAPQLVEVPPVGIRRSPTDTDLDQRIAALQQ